MQRIKALGLALVAVLSLSAIAVSSASASSFLAHPLGLILDRNLNNHKFKTNGGTIECTSAISHGSAKALKTLTNIEVIRYSNCTAFTFVGAEISPAEYEFSADLKATLLNTVTINVTGAGCTVTVAPAGNANLNSVHYSNIGKDLKVNAKVTGITYTSSGGLCGTSGTNGEYTGESVAWLDNGGTLRWDKE